MDFETIPAKDLNDFVRNGRMIIDLRSPEEYREKHIMGAWNIPYEEFEKNGPFPMDQELILYCDRGALSMAAARKLAEQGYRVKTVVGGIRAYRGPYLISGED